MRARVIHVERETTATRAAVWAVLDDSPGWVNWTPLSECKVLVGRSKDQNEIRQVRNGRIVLQEAIVDRVPGQRLAYTVLRGLAVRDYVATIELLEVADDREARTRIVWHTRFRPKGFGLGPLYVRALRRATVEFVDGLVSAAQRGARVDGTSGDKEADHDTPVRQSSE